MTIRAHPTHHDNYRPSRLLWSVGVGLAGVFAAIFLAMVDTDDYPGLIHGAKVVALWLCGFAAVGRTAFAVVADVTHRFTRCPTCATVLVRRRMDYHRSYYPCRSCDVTWTCPCHKAANGI